MNFTRHDLGSRKAGEVVQITLSGNAANVRLMDSSNFSKYKAGQSHRFIGGLIKQSPYNLKIPSSGHWYVAVDLQGFSGRGSVRSSARVLPGALPAAPRQQPLTSTPTLVRPAPAASDDSAYDVFISHASEDKEAVVRQLAASLQAQGLTVWFDEQTLRIGDSLRRKIDQGLARSRVGLVVISRSFIGKGWPNYELDGIVTRSVSGDQILIPIWHDITKQEVSDFSPSLADKVARSTATHTVDEIAAEIADLIQCSDAAAI